jgi:hypothetical protein
LIYNKNQLKKPKNGQIPWMHLGKIKMSKDMNNLKKRRNKEEKWMHLKENIKYNRKSNS